MATVIGFHKFGADFAKQCGLFSAGVCEREQPTWPCRCMIHWCCVNGRHTKNTLCHALGHYYIWFVFNSEELIVTCLLSIVQVDCILCKSVLSPSSSSHVQCVAISHPHIAIAYNLAGCSKLGGCALHSRIPHPLHVSLTRGCASVVSTQQFSCSVFSYQLRKRSHYI